MMHLAQRTEAAFKSLYKPDGLNFGMNLGRAAGAGIAATASARAAPLGRRRQLHVRHRRNRVLPEDLATTFERVRAALT